MALRFFGLEQYFTANGKLYNCSPYAQEYWQATTTRNIGIGILYLVSGLTYQLLYIPCLYVISQPKQIRHSCFKIMFFLGILDMICLTINADLSGYFSIIGANFCSYPTLIYIVGSIAIGMWTGSCYCCILLAFDRCLDLWKPHLKDTLFKGCRTWIWLIGCAIYVSYFVFHNKPVIYDSAYSTWFFDPHIPNRPVGLYMSIAHDINNCIVVVMIPILYVFLCTLIYFHTRGAHTQGISESKKKVCDTKVVAEDLFEEEIPVFIQAVFICTIELIAASLCVWVQYMPTPRSLMILLQITWQASHGSVAVIYLTINSTLRNEVLKATLSKIHPWWQLRSASDTKNTLRRGQNGDASVFTTGATIKMATKMVNVEEVSSRHNVPGA